MAKGHEYGLVTQEVLNGREQTVGNGYKLKSADRLDKADVMSALAVLLKSNPNFDKLSASVAADRITAQLKKMGFNGQLSNSGGKIKDSYGSIFQISHGKHKGKSIVTVNTIQENKKKK